MFKKLSLIAISTLALAACNDQASSGGAGGARQEIRIVGSSTVFPFSKAVAEAFQKADTSRKNPVVESTGTGGGIEAFCAGVGAQTPDIANASRRMKKSEFETCQKNGVTDIVEIQVGIDGIAIAESVKGPSMKLTVVDVYKAVAANPFGKPNTAKNWSDVNPSLPNLPIAVYGPPKTSGTRDAFAELILEAGCKTDAATKALKDSDKDKYEAVCYDVRTDGAYKEQGENDNMIVQKLAANPNMLGVFGYSYMEENAATVRGIAIDGVSPSYDAIASGSYPGARPLFIYVKKAHVDKIPGIKEFLAEFVSAGVKGSYLAKLGLIAAPDDVRKAASDAATNLTPIDGSQLK
ncbi:MAG: phosphate ABC transporter substrate-binding protein [Sphingomonadales bacterium]|nr:phosphate ABC transporter substrate-binding protein [Sphingomonadales bacterium]